MTEQTKVEQAIESQAQTLKPIKPWIAEIPDMRIYGKPDRVKNDMNITLHHGDENIPICGKNRMLLVKGRDKSRKSILANCILMSNFTRNEKYTLGFKLCLEPDEVIIHFDTEMGKEDVENRKEQFNDICNLDPENDVYQVYDIEPYSYRQRRDIIEYVILEHIKSGTKLGAVVIDQAADLLKGYNVNDTDDISDAAERILYWKRIADCMVIVLMHTNRGGVETNGLYGKILDDKTYASLLCSRDEETNITTVSHKTRGRPIDDFRFRHDLVTGLPRYLKDESQLFN